MNSQSRAAVFELLHASAAGRMRIIVPLFAAAGSGAQLQKRVL